ncbi:fibrillarin-like rRNA/tRNA 2'-O-methyltransferase [Thermoplasma sp.]|uniref:fibrillarin-like rRNA/tRNA 2'-O-methyltransferase n=1 Tax=Thermoplasma sp. TaxID=1973142 RepID=UPI0012818480|nr:fibrillarin-like rRNA/tRNA 2'-O-methyltransferase [Thermoplasma sp.]KAA8923184.1 MAG: fibrillarin-like rRNA/tRNA 2'-O-methyltransferase [Thermoplasma sp.]
MADGTWKRSSQPVFLYGSKIILKIGSRVYTKTAKNRKVYGEDIIRFDHANYREWKPDRSKLAAAILKGLHHMPITESSSVLYLGASTGTTVSHVSDLVPNGRVYAVEVAYEPFSKLLDLSEQRENIYPILEDANLPERYRFFIDHVDVMYQDISQRNQIAIFNRNMDEFHARSAFLVLKTRSIASTEDSRSILKKTVDQLSTYNIREIIDLSPYDTDHYLILIDSNKIR